MSNRILTAVFLTTSFSVSVADPVTECRARFAATPEEHIACLEAALAARRESPAAEGDASGIGPESRTEREPVTSPVFPVSTGSRVNPESEASPRSQPGPDSENSSEHQARSEHQGISESRTDPEPDVTPAPVSGLGAEQVRDRQTLDESRPDEVEVYILSSTYNARGLGTFRMADGQVWRETTASPEHKRLKPDREYQARIKRSVMGGYRMHVEGVRWMMTVERVD